MSKQFKKFLKIYIWVAIICLIIRCSFSIDSLINDLSLYDIYCYAGEAIGVATFIMVFYERKLWRYNPCNDTPILYRKYSGTFTSSYDNIERSCSLEIRQTLLTISIIFITSESKSKSIIASIDDLHGEKVLTYCYLNTTNALIRDRSPIHYGTSILCIDNPRELKGQYYTDRKTTGDMKFNAEI